MQIRVSFVKFLVYSMYKIKKLLFSPILRDYLEKEMFRQICKRLCIIRCKGKALSRKFKVLA